MPTLDAKQTITSESTGMVGRHDLINGNARVGDIVAIAEFDSYNIARISSRSSSREDNFQTVQYHIKMLTGELEGHDLPVYEPKNGKYVNIRTVSRYPQKALDEKGAIETKLVPRTDMGLLQPSNMDMHAGKLAIVILGDESETAYALVKIVKFNGRAKYREGRFIGAEFKVDLLAAPPSEKPRPYRMLVDIKDFVDNPRYELLK